MSASIRCFHCGHQWQISDRLGFREECPSCHRDAHVCLNCQHYDPGAYNECREPTADIVRDKERANFCEHFVAADRGAKKDERDALLSAAEALFKKPK